MTVTVAGVVFDRVQYDDEGDVLYLHVGDPSSAVDFDVSPEGHGLRFSSDGKLVGITIVNARWLLDQPDALVITLPERVIVDRAALAPAIHAA